MEWRLPDHWPTGSIVAACVVLVAIVGWCDYRTGWEMSFSILYLAPVVLAARHGHPRLWPIVAASSAVTSLLVGLSSGHPYSQLWMPFWNATARLGIYLFAGRLVVSLRRHLEIERTMARTDPLTGLMNRRAFGEMLVIHFDLAAREPQDQTLVFFDLDDFKLVNDRHGHAEGDRLLSSVARCLQDSIRRQDRASRLGGDEFAVFLPSTGREGAEIVVGKLRDALRRLTAAEGWPVTFSIGVATFRRPPADANEALSAADRLMYEVKGSTKNGVAYRTLD